MAVLKKIVLVLAVIVVASWLAPVGRPGSHWHDRVQERATDALAIGGDASQSLLPAADAADCQSITPCNTAAWPASGQLSSRMSSSNSTRAWPDGRDYGPESAIAAPPTPPPRKS